MTDNKQNSSRRKFVEWGIGALAAFSAIGLFFSQKKKKKIVKMLTQDGRLVEVDEALIKSTGKKINNKEIHSWVKNKQKPTTNN
jgi:hypothetical protein